MRRGAGLAAFDRHEQSNKSFAQLSNTLSQTQVDQLHSQLDQFRTALARFATDHREDIKKDPTFRHAFQQMCASIGVDPLAGPKKGGWWAEMLGLGDWQYELGVQIVDICVSTRDRNGGMIEMDELIRMLSKLRGVGSGEITAEDVVRSIKTLEPLGAGYQVIEVGGRRMVRSVTKELDEDQTTILALARQTDGRITIPLLVEMRQWTRERAATALEVMLLEDGLCWLDEQDEECGRSYWIPSAMQLE